MDPLLDSLALLKPERRPTSRELTGQPICKVRYSHQDMADAIIANPTITQNELAKRYGYTAPWVSQVINSDAFQAYLAARKAEIVDPTLTMTVEERVRGVTNRALDVMQEKLSLPAEMISDELAIRAAQMGTKALGMGNAPPPAPAPATSLNDLAERLVSLARRPPSQGVIDVETREVSPAGTTPAYPGKPGPSAVSAGPTQG